MRHRLIRTVLVPAAVLVLGGAATLWAGAAPPPASTVAGPGPLLPSGVYVSPSGRGDPADAVVAIHTTRRLVALSFDDGPDPRWTPPILRALRRAHAHATFFVIGRQVRAYPALVRRAVAWGDEVGNHTWSHPLLTRLDRAAVRFQVDRGRRALLDVGVAAPRFFRPPHGAFDRTVTRAARAVGERTIGWDVPLDRDLRGRSVAEAVARTAARAQPGSIILAHDGGGRLRARTVRAVPLLLAALRRRGLRVVSIGALLAARRGPPASSGA